MIQYLSKLLNILSTKKSTLIFLSLLFFGASTLEVFGIGVIGPFIAVASKPEIIHQNYWLETIFKYSGITQEGQFIALAGLFVIVIYVAKSIFGWLTQVYILRFSNLQQAELASRLVRSYLNAPYLFHIQNNSAYVINNVLQLIRALASGILIPLLTIISNVLMTVFILFLLCFTNLSIIVVFLAVLFPLLILYNSFKDRFEKWGEEGRIAQQAMISTINHGLGGVKETRVIGCEAYFEKQLSKHAHKLSDLSTKFFAFKLLPRYIAETLMVLAIVGIISVFLLLNRNIEELTSILGIYALAALRIIPLISNSASGLSTLRNNNHVLDKLYLDLIELEASKIAAEKIKPSVITEPHNSVAHPEKGIVLDKISFHYPNIAVNAISKMSLVVSRGESIALIGKSGAGKTTLVDLILGLLTPQSGDIRIDGKSIYENLRGWQNSIGYIPQSIFLIDDSLERNIAFGVPDHLIDRNRLHQSIEAAQLTEVVNNLPQGIKTQVGERGVLLSGGQRQRVGIARALYHERDILVLDEATAALDNETENLITQSIQSLSGNKTMIHIAHRLTTVAHCDRIYLLDQGSYSSVW